MSNIRQIARTRCDDLLRMWHRDPLIPVQVENPAALGQMEQLDITGAGDTSTLGRRKENNVVVVTPRGVGGASLWVRANYDGYRSAFAAFLNRQYGLSAVSKDLAGLDADHLLNRKRSPGGGTFIRLEAVPSEVNQAWGSLFERAASRPGFFANQARTRRTLSWAIAGKLAWIMPPSGPEDTQGISRVANGLARYGLNADEARDGLSSMLDFANRDLG